MSSGDPLSARPTKRPVAAGIRMILCPPWYAVNMEAHQMPILSGKRGIWARRLSAQRLPPRNCQKLIEKLV